MATIKAKRNIIREEEKLNEEVRKFRVLYSKQHSDHKDEKHVLNNGWSSVDQALGLEEGSFYFILRPLVVSFLLCFLIVCSSTLLFLYSFSRLLVHSSDWSFVGLFIRLVVCWFIHPIGRLLVHSSDWSFVGSFIRLVVCWFIHPIGRLLVHSSDWSFVGSFIRLVVCWFIHPIDRLLVHSSDWSYPRSFVLRFVRVFIFLFVCEFACLLFDGFTNRGETKDR